MGIALSLCYLTEKTPEGEFFTYDEESRVTGRKMFGVAVAVIAVVVFIRLAGLVSVLRSRDRAASWRSRFLPVNRAFSAPRFCGSMNAGLRPGLV